MTAGTTMNVIFILLTFNVYLLHSCFACSDYEILQLKEQVSELNTKVDALTNELNTKVDVLTNELRQFIQNFKQPSCETSGGKEDNSVEQTGDEDESSTEADDKNWTPPTPPFSLVEARREILGDAVKFTVQFTSNSNDPFLTVRWQSSSGDNVEWNESAQLDDEGHKVYETSALLSLPEDIEDAPDTGPGRTLAFLFLVTGDSKEDLLLFLDYKPTNAVNRNFTTPSFEVIPDGDFVYEEGQDFIFKMRMPNFDNERSGSSEVLLNPSAGEAVKDFSGSHIDFIARERLEDYSEVTFKVDTSNGSLSGFLDLNKEQQTNSAVVGTILRQRRVILRPEGQAGPFPDGFLSFVKQTFVYFGDNHNDNVTECIVGQLCQFTCEVVGSDITKVEVVTVGSDGNSRPLDRSKYDVDEFHVPYQSHKMVTFYENSVPETPEVLRCTARNAERTISMDSTVMVTLPGDVIEEESAIQLLDDESDTDVTKFQINCTARGFPQPDLSLTINTLNSNFVSGAEEVIPTGEYKYTLVKDINIPTSDYNRSDWYLTVTCYAARTFSGWVDDSVTIDYNGNAPWGMTFNFTNPYYY